MLEHSWEFTAIGTSWQITSDQALSADLTATIAAGVEQFDATYSRFRADSLVTALAREPGRVTFPVEDAGLFGLYRQLYECTEGAVTPLVGHSLEHWGYDAAYRLLPRPGPPPAVPAWDQVMTVDGTRVSTRTPLLLDFGAAGKGYLVDRVASWLDDAGVQRYLIDASGDLVRRAPGSESVALQDPRRSDGAVGVVALAEGALCASSVARRRWATDLHHLIDPATSSPTELVLASWVAAPHCAVADGLATALFFTAAERLAEAFDFEYARLDHDGRGVCSVGFAGELFVIGS